MYDSGEQATTTEPDRVASRSRGPRPVGSQITVRIGRVFPFELLAVNQWKNGVTPIGEQLAANQWKNVRPEESTIIKQLFNYCDDRGVKYSRKTEKPR